MWLLEDCIKLFGGQKDGSASASATCREDCSVNQVIEVKQLFPSTQAENWEVVCVYLFVSLISLL